MPPPAALQSFQDLILPCGLVTQHVSCEASPLYLASNACFVAHLTSKQRDVWGLLDSQPVHIFARYPT